MTPDEVNAPLTPRRVSILGRLVPAFSHVIPPTAAAVSAILFMAVMRGMRMAETAGIAAVAGGMAEANLPVVIALAFAIAVGVIGIVIAVIRLLVPTTTASPSAWFFLIAGGLSLLPLLLLWKAESLLVQGLSPGSGGVVQVASSIELCLMLTLIIAAGADLILLIGAVAPLPALLRARRSYAPLLVLVLMELALIGIAIAFQMRMSWFQQVRLSERL